MLHRLVRLTGLPHVARAVRRGRLLVVCYHGVRRDDDAARHWLLLPQGELDAQVRYLAKHYDCLPIDDALARLWSGRLRKPTACVTFDDGYRNNLELALPVLKKHGVPATIYLATALVGTHDLLWTTTLELAFARSGTASIDLNALGLGSVSLGSDPERRRTAKTVVETLKRRPVRERRPITDALVAALLAGDDAPLDPAGNFALMSWAEVDAVARSGLVTLGGHTQHHEIVSQLDDDEIESEIGGSIDAVQRAVPNATTTTFAYPNGRPEDFDARAERVLAARGMSAVTTTRALAARDDARTRLPRLVIGADVTTDHFVTAAAGFGG